MFRNLSLWISYGICIHTFRKGWYEVIEISRYYLIFCNKKLTTVVGKYR